VQDILDASFEELTSVTGITTALAQAIKAGLE
jgi:DNA integrity scanning protein DisA with diadenylate cyclase activity